MGWASGLSTGLAGLLQVNKALPRKPTQGGGVICDGREAGAAWGSIWGNGQENVADLGYLPLGGNDELHTWLRGQSFKTQPRLGTNHGHSP